MYVPPYDVILKAIGLSRDEIQQRESVTIPSSLLKFLLEIAVANSEFDEERYLASNPDIIDATRDGTVVGAYWHYTGFGYFECRKGGGCEVDGAWYGRTYPDVAEAIERGSIRSASEHFEVAGAQEWRAPRPELVPDVARWKKSVGIK